MAPNFQGILSCCQLKMISCVLMECATEIENVHCFLPLHMLPSRKKESIRLILEEGLSTILGSAKQKSLLRGKLRITQERQDQIDPYLSNFYNSYSLAGNYTQPYQDSLEVPKEVYFKVNTQFIAEGEEDQVMVEVLIHPLCEITMFMWKEFTRKGDYLHIRYKKITWKIRIMDSLILSFKFVPLEKSLYLDGIFLGKILYYNLIQLYIYCISQIDMITGQRTEYPWMKCLRSYKVKT